MSKEGEESQSLIPNRESVENMNGGRQHTFINTEWKAPTCSLTLLSNFLLFILFSSQHTVQPLCCHMTLLDCAESTKMKSTGSWKRKKKKHKYLKVEPHPASWGALHTGAALIPSHHLIFLPRRTLLPGDITRNTRIGAHAEEMCVQGLIFVSLTACLFSIFIMWLVLFFLTSLCALGQRACQPLFSHCCAQWHKVLCSFH